MSANADWNNLPMSGILARWDSLALHWGLDDEQRSALLGRCGDGPVDQVSTYDHKTAENRLRLLVALEPVLDQVFPNERHTRVWLRRSNVNLQGRTPLEVMAQSPEWIRWLIDALGIAA